MDPSTGAPAGADGTAGGAAPAAAGDAAPAAGTPPAAPAGEGAPAPAAPAEGGAPAAGTPAAPAEPAAPARADVTARLAALSKQNREAARAARAAEQRAAAAEAKAADFDTLIAKAANDPAAMDALFAKANLNFEKIVNRYAETTPELTAEQSQAKAIDDLRAELQAQKQAREDERRAAEATALRRQAETAKAETLGSISQMITKQADKYEICARLGDEAASDVFTEVVDAWKKAGQPQLMPGEFEEAVQAAIELQELRYEERGKKLAKAARAAAGAPPAGAAAPAKEGLAPKGDPLPAELIGGGKTISDKDTDILKGLIDKTAPAYDSQRAKPRTINSSLGGSAPPRAPARGSMDPRDALREVLAPLQRQ